MNQIKIFDTTLRDGEQSPGCSMNLKEKIEVAKCLERLKVDVIEAGFAISSPGDFESVKTIAETVRDCSVASLARATQKDIELYFINISEPTRQAEISYAVFCLKKNIEANIGGLLRNRRQLNSMQNTWTDDDRMDIDVS